MLSINEVAIRYSKPASGQLLRAVYMYQLTPVKGSMDTNSQLCKGHMYVAVAGTSQQTCEEKVIIIIKLLWPPTLTKISPTGIIKQ